MIYRVSCCLQEDQDKPCNKPTKYHSMSNPPLAKRHKTEVVVAEAGNDVAISTSSSPATFLTWNCNGLASRCNWNAPELKQLLKNTNYPDVICLQEVRLKASSSSIRGIPLPSDYQNGVKAIMKELFSEYDTYWSLADKKYAGTLTLLHKRLQCTQLAVETAFTTQSALTLLLKKYKLTRQDIGLSHENATTATTNTSTSPVKKARQTQATMKSFFTPKASPQKSLVPITGNKHHEEGRFQFFSFPHMDLIQTYVPNNGSKSESYQRRREWDKDMKDFLVARKNLLEKAKQPQRPLLWCGDCNVAKTYHDGSHWQQQNDGSIYEWWKDESKCFAVGQGGEKLDPNRDAGDKGIASFTDNERRRFLDILETADLSDVWRELHPDGVLTITDDDKKDNNRRFPTIWDRPNYTWRGHLSKEGSKFQSKYEGKAQRIDYFLLSPSEVTQEVVESCDILGYGKTREGFCGSDHCPQLLKLKKPFSNGVE